MTRTEIFRLGSGDAMPTHTAPLRNDAAYYIVRDIPSDVSTDAVRKQLRCITLWQTGFPKHLAVPWAQIDGLSEGAIVRL